MRARTTVGALTLLAAVALFAQTTAPARLPYTGVIAGKDVYVRCGPGPAYYACERLSFPDRVRVVGESDGWSKILPPRTCFSLIAKEYVRRQGEKGTVTGTNVRVRAGSVVIPQRQDRIQIRLNVGNEVHVLGEMGEYYKVEPPAGVFLWVSSQYVRAIGAEPVATTAPTQPAPPQPAPTTKTVVVGPVEADELVAQKAQFDAAERALKAEYEKPAEQRDLTALLDKYKAIKLVPDSLLRPWVEARVEFLQQEIAQAAESLAVDKLIRDVATTRAQWAAERERIQTVIPEVPVRRTYAVEGVLAPSGLYRGGATGPKRYVLRDPGKPLIYAYLQCTTGVVDLAKHVGAYVGAIGTPRYDAGSGMYIVEVEQIILLRLPATKPAVTTAPAATTKPIVIRPPVTTAPAATTKPIVIIRPPVTTAPAATIKPIVIIRPPVTTAPAARSEQPKPPPKPPVEKPAPAPEPEPEAPEPEVEESPSASETEEPLPPTGLPVVEQTTQPSPEAGVDPKEYE